MRQPSWQQQNGSTETIGWEHRDISNASVRGGTVAAELDPLGMNAGLINPFPHPSTRPSLQATRTYPGFGGIGSGQCQIDRVDVPCDILQNLMRAGDIKSEYPGLRDPSTKFPLTKPIREIGLGLYGVWLPTDFRNEKQHGDLSRNLVYLGASFGISQQNPERPLTKEEVEKIKGEVAAMLSKDKCKKFIDSLLAAAAKLTGGTYSADVLANFDTVAQEGGFHARYERVGTMPNGAPIYAGGDQTGPSVGSGKARVDFNPDKVATMNQFNNIIYVALAALHEVLHASGDGFDDSTFARAVARMNGLEPPKRASNMQEVLERSGEWNKALTDACLIWRSPVTGGKK